MKPETLQQIYNLISKYHKLKWLVKFDEVVMGKNITVIYNLENFLQNFEHEWNSNGLDYDEVKVDKSTMKFLLEVEKFTGVDFYESNFLSEHLYDAHNFIAEEAKFFYDLKLSREMMTYIYSIFYANGKFQSWKSVLKNYDPDIEIKTTTIKLSNDYSAVLAKGKPVQVGCQRIPIDTIREIVKAYDAL